MESPSPGVELEPLSPVRYSKMVLRDLSQEDLIEKVLELEGALNEFQESSKELEQALEEELQEFEKTTNKLHRSLDSTVDELSQAKTKIISLTQELNNTIEYSSTKLRESEDKITALKQQLVSVEIANDSIENNDRMISDKLELANQFNNELLEKLALLENDLERERKSGVEKLLYISNYQNEVRELTEKVTTLEANVEEGDMLVISWREALRDGPRTTSSLGSLKGGMTKSASLKKIHSMTEGVTSFILNSTTMGTLKSPSTTTTTNLNILASTADATNAAELSRTSSKTSVRKTITPSPSSTDLKHQESPLSSNRSNSSIFSKESKKSNTSRESKRLHTKKIMQDLSPIKGSPNPPKRITDVKEKPRSKFNILRLK